jgi:hypothetical protein
MSLKWIGLSMMAGGAVAVGGAVAMDSSSSFERGTFMGEMILGGGGIIAFVIGAGLIFVDVILNLT